MTPLRYCSSPGSRLSALTMGDAHRRRGHPLASATEVQPGGVPPPSGSQRFKRARPLDLKRITCLLIALLTAAGGADLPVSSVPTPALTINIRDRGAVGDGTTDDSPAIMQAIEDAHTLGPGASVYVPAGRYLCRARELVIAQFHDFTFAGAGADSIIVQKAPDRHVLNLNECSRVTIRNLTLDRADYYFTQGTILSVDAAAKTLDVALDPGFPQPDDPLLAGDRDIRVFRAPDCGYFAQQGLARSGTRMEKLAHGQWRFHMDYLEPGFAGRKFIFWTDCHGGHGVNGRSCSDCLFEDITYYGRGANAGILLWNCDGTTTFRRYRIDVVPGSQALLSCSGGGMEIDMRGKLVYDHCDFRRFDDDGADITTHYTQIVEHPAPATIVVADNQNFRVGDRFAHVNWVTKEEQAGFTIRAIGTAKEKEKGQAVLTLDHAMAVYRMGFDAPNLPFEEVLKNGYDRVVDYNNTCTTAEFHECSFQCLRARPLNLKAQHCLVDHCTFSNSEGQAISGGPEAAWMEAPYVHDLTIRGCTFTNNAITCIDIDIFQGMKECTSYGNQDILIEGNTFRLCGACVRTPPLPSRGDWRASENFGALAVHMHHCDRVIIRGNDFGERAPTAPAFKPMVLIEHCAHVSLENNRNLPTQEIVQKD